MKNLLVSLFGLLAPFAGVASAASSQQKTFERATLEFAFAEIRKSTDWNLDGKLLWGFFFTSPTKPPLIEASKVLEKMGYRVVSVYLDEEKKDWWLHVERIEVHSVDSLHARNQQLVKFAAEKKLGTYDGWDAGQLPNEKKG